MRILLVHNPKAGHDDQPDADDLTRIIHGAGHAVTARACEEVSRSECEVFKESCDLIVIAGGDGTAGRVAKQLLGCSVPIAFLPMGTANNLARSLGLVGRPLAELAAGWGRAPVRGIDVGTIDAPWGSEYFIEAMGAGLFTRTMLEVHAFNSLAHANTPREKVAAALGLMREQLRSYPARPMRLRLDGRDLSGEYVMLEAMNIRFVGPNLYVAPGCDPGDGLLDVVLVGEPEREHMLTLLAHWQDGQLLRPELPTYRGSNLTIDWDGSALHVDDETWPPDGTWRELAPARIDVRVQANAMQVVVP